MKKIINNPDQFVDEMVEGILLAHPDQVRTPGDDRRVLVRADSPAPGRVGIVTGGGSGHLPLFKGYVGKGLCSGVAIGNVFSSPSVQQCADAAKAVDGGAGVLFLYGNYGGDVFNFDLAVDLLELDGIETRTVLGCDDVASQPKERAKDRRGVAGIFFAYKAAGAAAERGDSLDEGVGRRNTHVLGDGPAHAQGRQISKGRHAPKPSRRRRGPCASSRGGRAPARRARSRGGPAGPRRPAHGGSRCGRR